jgi:hypothetical protein
MFFDRSVRLIFSSNFLGAGWSGGSDSCVWYRSLAMLFTALSIASSRGCFELAFLKESDLRSGRGLFVPRRTRFLRADIR